MEDENKIEISDITLSSAFFEDLSKDCVKRISERWKVKLDYTPKSLKKLDMIIDANWPKGYFKDTLFFGEDTSSKTFTNAILEFGSYFGEVLIRKLGGKWERIKDDPYEYFVNIGGNKINVFHIAENCLRGLSKFYFIYLGLKGEIENQK